MFNIVLIIKLIEDLRAIMAEIEANEHIMDDLSMVRVSKALGTASKVATLALHKEEMKDAKAAVISNKALAKVARAALLSLKVKAKPSVVGGDVKSSVVVGDVKSDSTK